jgi:hypothetical protein
VALAAALAGFTLWAGENCGVFLPVEAAVVLVETLRAIRSGRLRRLGALSLAGLTGILPPTAVIVLGKHFSFRLREFYRFVPWRETLDNFTHLTQTFRGLAPLFGGLLYPLAAMLAVLSLALFWRWVREFSSELDPLMVLGSAPLLTLIGVCASMWYLSNAHSSRYFDFGIQVALVALCLLLERASSQWSGIGGQITSASAALALAVGWVATAAPGQPAAIKFFESGRIKYVRTTGQQWRAKTALALQAGCQGLIGDYWQSYPYLTLSQGAILATPHEKAYVRSKPLAAEVVRQSVVCVVPWNSPPGDCAPELTQFGAQLTLRDRFEGKADDEAVVFCRYRRSSFDTGPPRGPGSG